MTGCDDPDRLGWDRVDAFLAHYGVCGFRLISTDKADKVSTELCGPHCRFDTWDVFPVDRASALPTCEAIIARGLSDDMDLRPADPTGRCLHGRR